ncbi:hypothetical protein BD414DRAFT_538510 [Trametes punicea]|nr:hypothetical protein BD414DRAFT_538510 [Trametes punicea]
MSAKLTGISADPSYWFDEHLITYVGSHYELVNASLLVGFIPDSRITSVPLWVIEAIPEELPRLTKGNVLLQILS